jgi:hypothetical protein
MVNMGFWLVLPYSAIRHHSQLKIAPAGVVPQRDRRPRPIMDYTFNSVNQASLPIAPLQSMQFGRAFQRLLQRIAYSNPAFGPVQMAKIDLADGYYRIPISPQASLALAVVLPSDGLSEPLLGLPLSLPMGWSHSPPYFCAFTETCADLANTHAPTNPSHPFQYALLPSPAAHPSEPTFTASTTFPFNPHPPQEQTKYTDVYLDDFMLLAQHPHTMPVMNNLLHHLSNIFYDAPDSPRRPVVSQSKVSKGDATFSTYKRLLGWDVDSATLTIHLPTHRVDRLTHLLDTYLPKKHTTRLQWQKLLGELRSMTMAIHSSVYLFSPLQQLLLNKGKRLRITNLARCTLHDWQQLLHSLHTHPVPITSLVPHAPHYIGTTDASQWGMGGCWFPTILAQDSQPCLWRNPLPAHITSNIITAANLTGTINNSELELAAAILGHATQLESTPPAPYTSTYLGTDNTPTQAWLTSGSVSSIKPTAYLLRRLATDCRRANATLTSIFLPGCTNTIADFLSRSFHWSDADLLNRMQYLFPVQPPWKLVTPPEHLVSEVNLALLSRLPDTAFPPPVSPAMTLRGPCGPSSVTPFIKTPGYQTWKTLCPSYNSMLSDTEWARWLPPALLSKVERWKQPFVPWGRRSPHWAMRTPGCKHPDA